MPPLPLLSGTFSGTDFMSTFQRFILPFAAFSFLLFGASGCGKKTDYGVKKKIAGIVFQEDQFFRLVIFGMREATSRNGVELLEANSAGKPDKEIQLINTYIASGVDAIVVSPLSAKASVSALSRAREKGIVVITYNTTVEGDLAAAYIESDHRDLGRTTGKAACEYIQRKLGGQAKIAILAFQSQAPEQSTARVGGFKEEVSRLPGVAIVAEQDAWLAEQAVKKAGDILTANPGVNILWAANEGGTVGAVMAVKNAGKAGKVAVFGTDTGEQLADFLLADDQVLQAVTGQRPFEIGSLAVESAVKVLKGEHVSKTVSLPGMLLSRQNPEEVRKFKDRLKELNK
jgi:ABC-type sugar transport system substrate-binding protein